MFAKNNSGVGNNVWIPVPLPAFVFFCLWIDGNTSLDSAASRSEYMYYLDIPNMAIEMTISHLHFSYLLSKSNI